MSIMEIYISKANKGLEFVLFYSPLKLELNLFYSNKLKSFCFVVVGIPHTQTWICLVKEDVCKALNERLYSCNAIIKKRGL